MIEFGFVYKFVHIWNVVGLRIESNNISKIKNNQNPRIIISPKDTLILIIIVSKLENGHGGSKVDIQFY